MLSGVAGKVDTWLILGHSSMCSTRASVRYLQTLSGTVLGMGSHIQQVL